jgi:hypothetical protein
MRPGQSSGAPGCCTLRRCVCAATARRPSQGMKASGSSPIERAVARWIASSPRSDGSLKDDARERMGSSMRTSTRRENAAFFFEEDAGPDKLRSTTRKRWVHVTALLTLLFAGQPLREAAAARGPGVMNTEAELSEGRDGRRWLPVPPDAGFESVNQLGAVRVTDLCRG